MAARRGTPRRKVVHEGALAKQPTLVLEVCGRTIAALERQEARFCLVGGLARAFLAEARSTRDVDFAVAAESEEEVDRIVRGLQSSGFVLRELFQRTDGKVATARLTWMALPVRADLLFGTSGIEAEVVAAAERREVLPGVHAPVVRRPHLIAMKLIAGRDQDLGDIGVLLDEAIAGDLAEVERLLGLVPAARRKEARALWRFLLGRRRQRKADLRPAPIRRPRR